MVHPRHRRRPGDRGERGRGRTGERGDDGDGGGRLRRFGGELRSSDSSSFSLREKGRRCECACERGLEIATENVLFGSAYWGCGRYNWNLSILRQVGREIRSSDLQELDDFWCPLNRPRPDATVPLFLSAVLGLLQRWLQHHAAEQLKKDALCCKSLSALQQRGTEA